MIEISGLIFVIVWGVAVAEPLGVNLSQIIPPMNGPHWIGIGAASLLAFFAFVGFEDMANVAEEVKDPVQTMPKAILWTLVLATVLYIGTTVAVLVAVPIDVLASSTAPLLLVFETAPERVRQSFSAVAIIATVNGVLIQMIMASRVLYGLADRGHLPALLARVSQRTKTPVISTIAVALLIMLFATMLPIDTLAARTSQIVLCVFIAVNIALIRLKLRGSRAGSYFRVPLFVPVLGVATSVILLGTAFL